MRSYRATPIDKPVDSGEFVYGYLIAYKGYSFIFSYKDKKGFIQSFIEVHPETIGQQVGLKDKNGKGKEIYGGDIIASENGILLEVVWRKLLGQWWTKFANTSHKGKWSEPLFEAANNNYMKIRGNIHTEPHNGKEGG